MCQETFVKWVQNFDADLEGFIAYFSIKMFHLLKVGFLGQEVLCIMEYLRQINHNNLITGENTDFPKSDIQKERYFILIIKYPIKDAACELKNFN